jgi:hypothetical protein
MSFYEKLDFITYDHDRLVTDVQKHVFGLGQQVIQGEEFETDAYKGFGGWSLQSQTGDWRDGWEFFQNEEGTTIEEVFFPKNANNYTTLKYFNIAHSLEYKKPTAAYQGEIAQLIDQIAEFGLMPRRARVTCLKAGSKSLVHRDCGENQYMARIHIPLITNPSCTFTAEGETLYMAPGTAYMVWVNVWHQIRNDSDQDRYHIIMDAYDTRHVTDRFKYMGDITQLETFANELRQQVDQAVVTADLAQKFESELAKWRTKPKVDAET